MTNYNTQLQNNNTDLQEVLQALQNKAAGSGEQATPTISVNTNGLITATAGAKSSTYQLAFQAAKTITPSTASQIAVSSGYYTGGNITVASVPTQSKTVTPTSTSQTVTPDSGKFLSKVTVNGDANLVAGNIKSGVSIFGVSGTLEEGSVSSGEQVEWSANEDAIINGEIGPVYTNDRITALRDHAFAECLKLTTVAFQYCSTIGKNAFFNCRKLTAASFPACVTIGSSAFAYCSSLATIFFPACKDVARYAFSQCSELTTASLSECVILDGSAFVNCKKLSMISFPNCIAIRNYAFSGCSNLTSISLPVCVNIGSMAFQYCSNLTSATFTACNNIESYAFEGCRTLFSLTLGSSSICVLKNSNAFRSTPYLGFSNYFSGAPYIYVPTSLVDAYKSATNWTYFSSYFSAIPDVEVGGDSSGKIITFTIGGEIFQAEEGMTWKEWIETDYNIDGVSIVGLYIRINGKAGNGIVFYNCSGEVFPQDSIVNNYNYTIY